MKTRRRVFWSSVLVGLVAAACTSCSTPMRAPTENHAAASTQNEPKEMTPPSREVGATRGSDRAPASVGQQKAVRRSAAPEFIPAADTWVTSKPPEKGYGHYVYVLLAKEPLGGTAKEINAVRRRNLTLLKAALGEHSPAASFLHQGYQKSQLNHILVPIRERPKAASDEVSAIEAVYRVYDFAFADGLQSAMGMAGERGPVLISTNVTILPGQAPPTDRIVQDMSRAPDAMILVWWDAALQQSSRPDFWRRDRMKEMVLDIRQAVEIAAQHVGLANDAIRRVMAVVGWTGGKEFGAGGE